MVQVPAWSPSGDVRTTFASILVPTIDSVRSEFTLESSLGQGRPVLLIGGPGTAKTSTVLQVLAKQNARPRLFVIADIAVFSAVCAVAARSLLLLMAAGCPC